MQLRRGQLGRRIEFYSHQQYGGKVPIYLDGAGEFSAVIGETVLKADTLQKIKKLAEQALKNQSNLEWISLIQISFGYRWNDSRNERNQTTKNIEFTFERYWIAKKIDGNWIKADWDVETWKDYGKPRKIEIGDRVERSENFHAFDVRNKLTGAHESTPNIKLPYTRKDEDRDSMPTYYLPYEEPLWLMLVELALRIDKLQTDLVTILGSAEKRNQLASQVQKILPAGKD